MRNKWMKLKFVDKALIVLSLCLSFLMYIGIGPISDRILFGTLCFLFSIGVFFLRSSPSSDKYKELILTFALCIFACIPICSDYLGKGIELGDTASLMFPNLFLRIIYFVKARGFLEITIYKIFVFCLSFLGGIGFYFTGKKITGEAFYGVVATAIYLLSLYRINVFFYRGNISEMIAISLMPIYVLGIIDISMGEYKKWYLSVLAFLVILVSSPLYANVILAITMCEVIVEVIKSICSRKSLMWKTISIQGNIIIEYILINIVYRVVKGHFYVDGSVVASGNRLSEHAAYFSQMFSFFPIASGNSNQLGSALSEMPITVGGALLIGTVLFCVFASFEEGNKMVKQIGNHCLIYSIILLIASSWIFPWTRIEGSMILMKLCSPMKYSWQLLGPGTVLLSVVSMCGIYLMVKKIKKKEILLAYAIILITSGVYFFDSMTFHMIDITDKPYYAEETVQLQQDIFY